MLKRPLALATVASEVPATRTVTPAPVPSAAWIDSGWEAPETARAPGAGPAGGVTLDPLTEPPLVLPLTET
jgi:hypothetical protein